MGKNEILLKYTFLTLKFGNHSLTPSNGLGIAATRLNTNRCALSSRKVSLLRPYSLINGCVLIRE
jgi:hypothetical protein